MLHPYLIRQQGLIDRYHLCLQTLIFHCHTSCSFVFPSGSMNVSIAKEEVKRRKAPCRPALVSTGHNHSELEEERRLTGPKWREGLRENTFDRTRVLKTLSTPREKNTRKSAVLLGKVYLWFVAILQLQTRLYGGLTVLTCSLWLFQRKSCWLEALSSQYDDITWSRRIRNKQVWNGSHFF